jgi:hypothetical protein
MVMGRATGEVIYVDFGLPARYDCGFHSSGNVCWYYGTDVSGRLIGVYLQGTGGLSRSVGILLSTHAM